uniref:Cytochrome P450 n=1 Tax=Meloidogyne floridensis TaxID=298350 RepID=A0A915P8E5_9BILA
MPIIDDSIKVNIHLLKQAELSGIHVDLHKYFDELTFDIISRIAMGQEDSRQFNSEFCKMAHDVFALQHNNIFDYIAFIFPWIGKNILDPFVAFTGKIRKDPLQLLIGKIYEARRVDFIDLFLESEVENNEVDLTKNNGNYSKTDKFERHTILEEIVLNCVLFLLAGFDTTSNNLSLMAHYLVIWLNGEELTFYYPFGGGPRICIGLRFAIMETKMILVRLLKTFELKRCLETEAELKFIGQIVLNPGKVFVELKLRK